MRGRIMVAVSGLLLAAGCQPPQLEIEGTITRDGQPLVWRDDEVRHLLVIFFPENRQANPRVYRADTDAEAGTYRIVGIPPGRYRVAIHQFGPGHRDYLQYRFDPGNSPIYVEVSETNRVVNIDLPK